MAAQEVGRPVFLPTVIGIPGQFRADTVHPKIISSRERNKVDSGPIGIETNRQEAALNPFLECDSQLPMTLQFIEQTALSPKTIWRFRKKRFLRRLRGPTEAGFQHNALIFLRGNYVSAPRVLRFAVQPCA